MTGLEGLRGEQWSWVEAASGSREEAGRVTGNLACSPAQLACLYAASQAQDRRRPGRPGAVRMGPQCSEEWGLPAAAVNKGGHGQQRLSSLRTVTGEP